MKNVLITGCSRGLGECLYHSFLEKGCRVIPHYRKLRDSISPECVIGDLTNEGTLDTIEEALQKYDIDIFINNAALYSSNNFTSYDEHEVKDLFNTNLVSQFFLLQRVYNYFLTKKSGLIININSLVCKNQSPTEALYGATKFGLQGLSKSLQLEAIGSGVHILDVYVGAMRTQMTKQRFNSFKENLIDPKEVSNMLSTMISVETISCFLNELVIRRV